MLATFLSALGQAFQAGSPVVVPPARGWDEFPVFVWREKYAGKPLPEELVEPFGGVILMREEDSGWARERGLSYLVWNVAGRDALHLDADEAWNARVEQWIETRDEELLVREPCLNDPETIEKLFATLDATLAKHGEHPGLGFVLGDEVGLTPNGDPFDLCRCDLCGAKWRTYAKARGFPERAPLTDEVRLQLLEDDYSGLGAWLARRRFDRARMTELVEDLAGRIHDSRPAPHLPVGLLGIGGPSAFGSIDLTEGLFPVDFLEAYPVNDARELLSALPERERRSPLGYVNPLRASLATVFLKAKTPEGASLQAWEHWLRGGNGLVLWSDTALEASAEHLQRLGGTVSRIRAIESRFPELLPPLFERNAIVQDDDSVALAWLKDALLDGATWPRRRSGFQTEQGTRELCTRDWLRLLEGQGTLPSSVPLRRLGELCFGGCRTLVLIHLLVLDHEDVRVLERQLDLGATLIVAGPLGWVDRNGNPWSENILERLDARAPDRVHVVPSDHGSPGESTLTAGAAAWWKPVFSGEAGKLPWLVSRRCTIPVGTHEPRPVDFLVTALPRIPHAAERAGLSKLQLQCAIPAGYALEWIHPEEGQALPPGDAAVLLLRKVESAR
jgi:hypothetical protein